MFRIKTNLLNRNKHYKIRVTRSLKMITDKILSLALKVLSTLLWNNHSADQCRQINREEVLSRSLGDRNIAYKRNAPSADKLCNVTKVIFFCHWKSKDHIISVLYLNTCVLAGWTSCTKQDHPCSEEGLALVWWSMQACIWPLTRGSSLLYLHVIGLGFTGKNLSAVKNETYSEAKR